MNVHERHSKYDANECWQYTMRRNNLAGDLITAGMTLQSAEQVKTSDFTFNYVPPSNKGQCAEVKLFIEKHEWLGKMPMSITHRFTAHYSGVLIGVIVMATPNAFSDLLGDGTRDTEKLISRGACASWTPVGTASWLLMQSIRCMVENTSYRLFTAYSDPEAKELGTIYQACNFYYLGQKFGSAKQYLDPDNTKRGWFGDTGFNDRSQIVRYAKKLGIEWQESWYRRVGIRQQYRKVDWDAMPEDARAAIVFERGIHKVKCEVRVSPRKHKYVYILGENKTETKALKKKFLARHKMIPYPKERGK